MTRKDFTEQASKGRNELKTICKNPNRIVDTLNKWHKNGEDLAEIDPSLSTSEFRKVGEQVSKYHTFPEAFSRSLLRKDHRGHYIRFNDTRLDTLGYIANKAGDVEAYTVDAYELIADSDLSVTPKQGGGVSATYTKEITPTETAYYNEFCTFVRLQLSAAEKAERAKKRAAEKATKQATREAEKAAKKALNEVTAAAKRECKNTLAGLTADYNNGRISATKFAAACKAAKKESDTKIAAAEKAYNEALKAA